MTLRSVDDYREWKFCVVCGSALTESKLLAKNPDGFISFVVGCKQGHTFALSYEPGRHEVALRPYRDKPAKTESSDTGLDAWGMCVVCGRLPDASGRCPVHG